MIFQGLQWFLRYYGAAAAFLNVFHGLPAIIHRKNAVNTGVFLRIFINLCRFSESVEKGYAADMQKNSRNNMGGIL